MTASEPGADVRGGTIINALRVTTWDGLVDAVIASASAGLWADAGRRMGDA